MLLLPVVPGRAMAERPVVLELFTSQGCSSCPPADALLTALARDPSLLALSFHVNYWDYLGWKDPYASPETTARQRAYAGTVGQGQVFTPQLVVDGAASAVGSDAGGVRAAIAASRTDASSAVGVAFSPLPSSGGLAVTFSGPWPAGAEAWLVYFRRHAETDVRAGENGGRRLAGTNVVTRIRRLETLDKNETQIHVTMPEEGVAVLVQKARQGRILGAGYFISP